LLAALYTQGGSVKINSLVDQAEHNLIKRVDGFEGALGTLDATLQNFGDYSITLSCISLLNPELIIKNGCPIAKFPGSSEPLPLDCFHVDTLHHSKADGQNPEIFKAIGVALAQSWNRVLKESNLAGGFIYTEENGYDVEYRI
jgi:hypothetical protein